MSSWEEEAASRVDDVRMVTAAGGSSRLVPADGGTRPNPFWGPEDARSGGRMWLLL